MVTTSTRVIVTGRRTEPISPAPRWRGPRRAWRLRDWLGTFLFFVPLLLTFAYFMWWPILSTLLLSLQQNNLVTDPTWVGFDNFRRVFADPLLWTAVRNTAWFTLLALVIGMPVPLVLAMLLVEFRRTQRVATVLAYLPVVVPPVVGVLLWKLFYDPSPDGLFNTALGVFGLGPVPWLQNPALAMPSIVLFATWAGFGSTTVIYLAALMSVRTELYDAAEIDGASIFGRFFHVTLPEVRGVVLLMMLLQIISTFQVFTEPFVMTGGGPENSTVTLLMLIYNYAFREGDFGKATALSLMLALFLGLISVIYLWLTRRWSKS